MSYAFKFISGKYQGGEFPIPDDGELIIGRASDLDLVLVEDMVSRKHAKLTASGGALSIMDLGSTNGTFVNGEKIRRSDLKRNDRILIGTSILKVIDVSEMTMDSEASDKHSIKEMLEELAIVQTKDQKVRRARVGTVVDSRDEQLVRLTVRQDHMRYVAYFEIKQ